MSLERKPNLQPRLFLLTDSQPRTARVGIQTDTSPSLEDKETPQLPLFNQKDLGRPERMSHAKGVKYWKRAYEAAFSAKKLDSEAAWNIYSTLHFGAVDEIKNILKRIRTGEVRGEEQYYNDPEFFRRKLLLKDLRPEKAYFYGLVALRVDEENPKKRQEFDDLGFSHLEKAEEMDPRNPKIKLALWKEHDRKAEERPKLKRKEKKEAKKIENYRLTPTLINRLNNPALGREFTTLHYIEKVDHWTNILEEVSKGRQIDYQKFRRKHAIYVKVAKKEMDDRRGPDKRRKRYTPQFFEDLLNYKDLDAFNAYYWGLVALYTPTKIEKDKKKCELLGFLLLEVAHDLSVIERKIDGKNPTAFYPWAIKEEYLVKMAQPGIQSKRQVRSRELSNMITRARGGEPEHVRDRKRPEAIDLDEALPF